MVHRVALCCPLLSINNIVKQFYTQDTFSLLLVLYSRLLSSVSLYLHPCSLALAAIVFNKLCTGILYLWCRLLIGFIHDRSQMVWRGYLYTLLLFLVAFVQSMMLHQYFHRCMVVGMRIRSSLVAAVYKKVCLLVHRLLVFYFLLESVDG